MMTDDFDLKALYVALDSKRSCRGLTWSGVAKEIEEHFVKVSPSTIKGVGERSRVEADGVLQMLLWLERTPESFVPGHSRNGGRLRPPGRGKILRWDTAAMFAALDRKRVGSNLTWNEAADQIGGITPQQLKGLARGGRTYLPEAMRVAVWLGIPASSLTKESAI